MKRFKANNIFNIKLKAFTLAELMTTLCIIGILVLLALPKLMPLISKTKSLEAQLQLKHVLQLEKTYFFMNSKYSTNLQEIGYEQAALVSEDGTANYKIEVVEATNKSFVAKATAVTDFDGDGVFDVWQVDEKEKLKEVTPD